ncbi:MAG: hypothetical protein IJF12_02305 [Alphaproteobacteria bacterium]|nr:hypothetical protein [Alphaproteobacteria bacterium]
MKKIIILLLVAAFLPLSASAYSYGGYKDVTVDITARGGYNFMENVPLAGGAVGVQFWGLRAELEAGWTSFNLPEGILKKDFCYISPMIGYSYGFNHKLYAMVGFTNWGYVDYYDKQPMFKQDIICAKIKVGGNLYITEHLFVNLDLSYLFPKHMDEYCLTYKGFNLMGGLGFRF